MGHRDMSNCLNLIRIIAAFRVFLGHAITHLNLNLPSGILKIIYCFDGVPIFFLISGFLIWNSMEHTNDFKSFIEKRILRLYPELWGGVLLSVISLLIIYGKNIDRNSFIMWIFTQSTILQFWTPDCLREFGCGTPNGALWTIGVMVQSYVVIWFLYRFLHKSSIKRWFIIILISIGINLITPLFERRIPELLYKLFNQTFLPYIWIFIIGAFLWEYFENIIVISKKYWLAFLIVSMIVSLGGIDAGVYGTLNVLFLAPAIVGFAYRFEKLNLSHDISYGVYIYHMVVINIMIELGMKGRISSLILAMAITVILAVISYCSIGSLSRRIKKKLIN